MKRSRSEKGVEVAALSEEVVAVRERVAAAALLQNHEVNVHFPKSRTWERDPVPLIGEL